eukprot:3556735-Rhodomonas_salina.2
MSGCSFLKKQLRGKKIGAEVQSVDQNTGETGKIQNRLLDIVSNLPAGIKGYRIAADNLFNSVDTCKKGVTLALMEAAKELKEQGDWAFQ